MRTLYGVGDQRAKQLDRLGITTTEELLRHYPRGYIDLTSPKTISSAPFDSLCAVRAHVIKKYPEARVRGTLSIFKVDVADETDVMELRFFNTRYAAESLQYEKEYFFYGRVEGAFTCRTMNTPEVFSTEDDNGFSARYHLTKGLSNKAISATVAQALKLILPDSTAESDYSEAMEIIPADVRMARNLPHIIEAFHDIHRPLNAEKLENARRRFIFEELFTLAIGVGLLRAGTRACRANALPVQDMKPFYRALPFNLTNAQKKAVEAFTDDLQKIVPANRLIQGDVGSGKTVVAAAGAYFAARAGAQAALMAPTEILAHQHFEGLSHLLGEKLGLKLGILTGSMSAAQKKEVRMKLAIGEIDLCIGTHALLSHGVNFKNLALVITDEQHRFGVAQRAALGKKSEMAHTLVMSATPIPRTLALVIYGELDVSTIDELPPGRQVVKTYKISSPKRKRAFGFIREHLKQGLQAYIVCALVEEGQDPTQTCDAISYADELRAGEFLDFNVGLLHGKMKAADKEAIMGAFQRGEIQLLITTTVIEVGVDVPNAVIMMIENAERFGLSQLHQLRGRVGRGTEQSYCILVSDSRNADTIERLKTLCSTNDGFAVADYDLQTRGPGNFLGLQQHGLPQMKIADLTSDMSVVTDAQKAAETILAQDPMLDMPEHLQLKNAAIKLLSMVGDRPN